MQSENDAVAQAQERETRRQLRSAESRSLSLERELQRTYGDLLELRGLHATARHATPTRPYDGEIADVRKRYKAIAERRGAAISLVTVLIPVYEKLEFTIRCLRSIADAWPDELWPTIVVIDDASPDGSAADLVTIPGVHVLSNGANLGYLRSNNRALALVDTPFTCFLNNDTHVKPKWLEWLVAALESDAGAGAAGSKLVYPDGKLQEAGGIIWSDASGWNVGRGDDPRKSQYNFRREVDYCSAASLLVRTPLLREIGGFDDRFAPAYYEDADLCFEIRRRGLRVLYEPRSEVVHWEGVSSGTDISGGVKRHQEINRSTFAAKWAQPLATHRAPSAENVEDGARRHRHPLRVLMIDSYVPMHDREAGSLRLLKILKILRGRGDQVMFLPDNFAAIEPYSTELRSLGVELLSAYPGSVGIESALGRALARADVAWICRPELFEKYAPTVREANVPMLYDTIDLHFLRERRRAEIEGIDDGRWMTIQALELDMARAADAVVTVTESERTVLRDLGIENVHVIPTIHDAEGGAGLPFDERHGAIFIGGYNHTPNVDAVQWLCNEILPLVWKELPELHVTLLGANPPEAVRALAGERVAVPGFLADVEPHFKAARLFLAPLRYGAGMKGKIGHALSYELPVITTPVGVEGFDLTDGVNCAIAEGAKAFAAAIVRLYRDRSEWEGIAAGSRETLIRVGSEAVTAALTTLLDDLAATKRAGAPAVLRTVSLQKPVLAVYGNCQAGALTAMLHADPILSERFDIRYEPSFDNPDVVPGTALSESDVRRAAVLFEQHDPQPFPHLSALPHGCVRVTFPSIDLGMLWPTYAITNPYNDPSAELPWGHFPYGDRLIIDDVEKGLGADEILERYLQGMAGALPDLPRFEKIERARLLARDKKCDIPLAAYVFKHLREQRMFWCINHPALDPLRELATRLLDRAGASNGDVRGTDFASSVARFAPGGPLGYHRVPMHPLVAQHYGLAWYESELSEKSFGDERSLVTYEQYFRDMIELSVERFQARASTVGAAS